MPARIITGGEFSRRLGAQLRAARRVARLTQADLSIHLGVTERTIRAIERGTTPVNGSRVDAWCRCCGVGISVQLLP